MTKKEKQMTGIEPASSAWEADILPMNYARPPCGIPHFHYTLFVKKNNPKTEIVPWPCSKRFLPRWTAASAASKGESLR